MNLLGSKLWTNQRTCFVMLCACFLQNAVDTNYVNQRADTANTQNRKPQLRICKYIGTAFDVEIWRLEKY